MPTAAPGIMGAVEEFQSQARRIDRVVRLNVRGVTQAESLVQPRPAGNCMNWVVGHILGIYDEWTLPLLGEDSVLARGTLSRYARGTPPLRDAAEALELQELLTAWDEAVRRIDAGLAGLTPKALVRPAPHSPNGNPDETVRSFLTGTFFHQAYHAGQLGLLRRLTGKEGAIP